jgi:hypothetical protein
MDNLQGMTLLSWTLQIYKDAKRGLPQTGHTSAVARAMQHHTEWWWDWEALDQGLATQDVSITNRLIHIHNDAAVLLQVQAQKPREVFVMYELLRQKSFTEFESIHTIALGLTEELSHVREHNEAFDQPRYLGRANRFTMEALSRPNMTRIAKSKVY